MQPRGVNGGSASQISLIVPMHDLLQLLFQAAEQASARPRSSAGWTLSQASTNGPTSQPQTVPW